MEVVCSAEGITGTWSFRFRFVTDAKRQEQLSIFEAQFNRILANQRERQERKNKVEHLRQQREREMCEMYQEARARGGYTAIFDQNEKGEPMGIQQGYYPVSTRVRKCIDQFDKSIQIELSKKRPAILPRNYLINDRLWQELRPKGIVATLGFVEDEHMARLLSWAAGDSMTAYLFPTNELQNRAVKQHRLLCYSMETLGSFYIQERGGVRRPRTPREVASKSLPLGDMSGVNGFIDFAVNIIQLPPNEENLRDTLFWNVYSRTMVFHTSEQGQEYMKECRKKRQQCPTIICFRDGIKIMSSGLMGGNR